VFSFDGALQKVACLVLDAERRLFNFCRAVEVFSLSYKVFIRLFCDKKVVIENMICSLIPNVEVNTLKTSQDPLVLRGLLY
jgi:hypothetical protein